MDQRSLRPGNFLVDAVLETVVLETPEAKQTRTTNTRITKAEPVEDVGKVSQARPSPAWNQ